jgi:hypothetical protein
VASDDLDLDPFLRKRLFAVVGSFVAALVIAVAVGRTPSSGGTPAPAPVERPIPSSTATYPVPGPTTAPNPRDG